MPVCVPCRSVSHRMQVFDLEGRVDENALNDHMQLSSDSSLLPNHSLLFKLVRQLRVAPSRISFEPSIELHVILDEKIKLVFIHLSHFVQDFIPVALHPKPPQEQKRRRIDGDTKDRSHLFRCPSQSAKCIPSDSVLAVDPRIRWI